MNFDVRYANHPDDSKKYDTAELRRHYHISNIFQKDAINLTYSHQDRIIAGGIMPVDEALVLESCKELAAPYFRPAGNWAPSTSAVTVSSFWTV